MQKCKSCFDNSENGHASLETRLIPTLENYSVTQKVRHHLLNMEPQSWGCCVSIQLPVIILQRNFKLIKVFKYYILIWLSKTRLKTTLKMQLYVAADLFCRCMLISSNGQVVLQDLVLKSISSYSGTIHNVKSYFRKKWWIWSQINLLTPFSIWSPHFDFQGKYVRSVFIASLISQKIPSIQTCVYRNVRNYD